MAARGGQVTELSRHTLLYWVGCGLLGSVPFAFLLGRLRGVDIRTIGSGNVGATNLARGAGFFWGVLAFLLDALKGWGPVMAGASWLGSPTWVQVSGGSLAVLGHCFSPFLRFRGGKGVATAAGVLAALDLRVFVVLILLWLVLVGALRNAGIASSLTALAAMILGAGLFLAPATLATAGGEGSKALAVFLLVLSALVILRHRRNLVEFLQKTAREPRR